MKSFSLKVQEMEHSPIRRFNRYADEAKEKGKKVYHLNIGQPDIKTPEVFWTAVKEFAHGVLAYESSPGHTPLITAMRDYYQTYGIDYAPEDIVITNGGSEALTLIALTLCNEGDEIIVAEPYYTNYSTFIKSAGAKIVPISTTPEEGYHYADREKIESKITERTKAILVTNPGNPTGTVLTAEERRLICDIAKEKDFFIISDEVYREFIYNGEPASSFGQYEDVADRVVVIDSVSKRYSACGARIGALISKNKELQNQVMKLLQGRLCVSTLDQVGAAQLYKLDAHYYAQAKAEYQKRRDVVYQALSEIDGVVCKEPPGSFYIMAKLPVKSAEDFLIYMLSEFSDNQETVMFAPAEGFYDTPGLGASEIRIAYMLNLRDMKRAMELLQKGIAAYNEAKRSVTSASGV